MRSKIVGTVCLVLGIIIIVSTGTSFAYFSATASSTGDVISGTTANFEVKLNSAVVYKATELVPLSDDLIDEAITKSSNKCIDSKGYDVCSLYGLTLSNTGDAQILNGYISTTSTTYTTDNLKCQLFDSSYNPVSDIITISRTANQRKYFKSGNNNIATEVNNKDVTYYLAIWLHETGELQNEDYAKTFAGEVVFESLYGDKISASFSS